jgi:hypothetical protein
MSNELTTAVEKFMQTQGVNPSKKSDAPALAAKDAKPNILIAMPCYAGQIHCMTVNMLMSLTRLLTKEGIKYETHFVCESLVPRARNQLASTAAFSTDAEARPFDSILFIDADISFDAASVLKLLDTNLPVVGLPCSRKVLNMAMVAEAAKRNINPANLLSFAGSPVVGVNESFTVSDKPVPVTHFGTGVMLIQTSVLKALAEMHPERRYRPNVAYDLELNFNFDFFRCGVRGETYLSEDYYFLEDIKNDLNIQPHIIPSAVTKHVGSQIFEMDMSALGSLHAVLEKEQMNAAQPAEVRK